jgi:hypothetical protein
LRALRTRARAIPIPFCDPDRAAKHGKRRAGERAPARMAAGFSPLIETI